MKTTHFNHHIWLYLLIVSALLFTSCNSGTKQSNQLVKSDSVKVLEKDTSIATTNNSAVASNKEATQQSTSSTAKTELPEVLIYNFYVTNRCVACIAIENATIKTLNTYFAAEMKQGRIKRQSLNVDDDFNKAIAMKYQAFGSSLFVTRKYKGKETTSDFTGDGFKYAKNKEDRFIEILKAKIEEYLK